MSLTKVFKSNHHDFAFPSHPWFSPCARCERACSRSLYKANCSRNDRRDWVPNCSAVYHVNMSPWKTHIYLFTGLSDMQVMMFFKSWICLNFGIQGILGNIRKSWRTSDPLFLLATSVKYSLVSERSCFCILFYYPVTPSLLRPRSPFSQ